MPLRGVFATSSSGGGRFTAGDGFYGVGSAERISTHDVIHAFCHNASLTASTAFSKNSSASLIERKSALVSMAGGSLVSCAPTLFPKGIES